MSEAAFQMLGRDATALVKEGRPRRWIYDAMKCAVPADSLDAPDEYAEAGSPWLTFVAFHFHQSSIPTGLLEFVADMVNREEILSAVRSRDFPPGAYLLRLPLPLRSTIGKIVTPTEYFAVDEVVSSLRTLREERGQQDHRHDMRLLVSDSILPIEIAHTDSLVQLARDDDEYGWKLY